MRILARLALLCATVLSLASVAVAGDKPAKPLKTDKPDKAEKAEKAPKDKAPKGEDDAEEGEQDPAPKPEDHPLHPHGGAPGQLKDPGEPAHPAFTNFAEQVGAAPSQGTVRIKLPGSDAFVALPNGQPVPVGTVVDATDGLVEIMSELSPGGVEQNAVVTGGVFRVDQDRATGITDLKLQGGDFSGCKAGDDADEAGSARAVTARAATARKKAAKRKGGQVARGIWAAGKGRFRTTGRNSSATVRGTRWATVDRCSSTTTKVFEGVVDVKDFGTGRTTAVRAGERHVARDRRG
jgi:uncharacterized cupin superfamily protein